MDADDLLELTAQIDHENPDYTALKEKIELLPNPWATLERVLVKVHVELL